LKNIDKNPTKFLTQNTISNLKKNSNTLSSSQPYKVLSQFLKLSSGFITAIPKSMLTIAILPFIMDIIFPQKKSFKKQTNFNYNIKTNSPEIFKEFDKNISFKGNNSQFLTKNIAKIFNNKKIQDFIIKHNFKETNIARNMSIATDILLTTSYTHRTLFDKKIKKENKKPLIYSNIFSTAISLFGGYSIDKLVQKNTKNFIKKFTETNKNDPKLSKYIQGINILRPTLIFAIIYYGLLPLASTYFGEKFDKFISNKKN
jgi:hypothetical protein